MRRSRLKFVRLGIRKAQADATVTSIVSRARTARCRTTALGLSRLFLAAFTMRHS